MLTLQHITHNYGPQTVLHDIDLTVHEGEILCLLGPSGCGKTTILRVVAGLEQPSAGTVELDGASILGIPVHKRGFGLMFQAYALFPHMTVAENVGFGLRMQHIDTAQREQRITEVLDLVGLTAFRNRDVTQLSGGEQQRVALARSLAPHPRLLMLDEPLGSLDAALREQLVMEIRDIIKAAGLTAIYVTHDQHEAFAIADRIAVMNAGRIEQIDPPETLYRHPHSVFTARFLGLDNIVPVQAVAEGQVKTPLGPFPVNWDGQATPRALLIHPVGLHPVDSTADSAQDHTLTGTICKSIFQGKEYEVNIRLDHPADEEPIILELNIPADATAQPPTDGAPLTVRIEPEAVIPLH